jgi:hypothetical protein
MDAKPEPPAPDELGRQPWGEIRSKATSRTGLSAISDGHQRKGL